MHSLFAYYCSSTNLRRHRRSRLKNDMAEKVFGVDARPEHHRGADARDKRRA
jgi:hypothetical protein